MNENNWSSYRRKQVNIEKAAYNPEISRLLQLHYKHLHSLLVRVEGDEDTFNDTYLKLTHSYNPNQDFIEQYKHTFYNLKYAYEQDDKQLNYLELTETYDKVTSISDNVSSNEDEEPVKKDKLKLTNLKLEIQNYAISKKAYKRKKQNH